MRREGGGQTAVWTRCVCVCVCVLRGRRGREGGRQGCSSLLATALGAQASGLVRAMTLPSSSSHFPPLLAAAVLCVLYVC
jgi:hypothetical protein